MVIVSSLNEWIHGNAMFLFQPNIFYPLANEVVKGYSNATVRPSVASLWTL